MKNLRPQPTSWNLLNDWSLVAIEGAQARNFLQGQVTCDLVDMPANLTRLGAHCNPKGRVLFSFRALLEHDQRLLLRLPSSMLETAQTTLGKYLAFFKAEQQSLAESVRLRGMAGPEARSLLTQHLAAPAEEPGCWVACGSQKILTLDEERFECWLPPEQAQHLDSLFDAYRNPDGDNLWRLLDIRAGLGEVLPHTCEAFVPQTLNYQLLDGVSFRKGCYTGQEVVARLHYRGKLKRHMHRISFSWPEDQPLPPAGTQLPPALEAEPAGPAQCVSAAPAASTSVEALVVLNNGDLKAELLTGDTRKLHILPLPYAIPSDSQENSNIE